MRIHVGNLSFLATEEDLKDLFSNYGQVDSVMIVKDKFSGQSRGFAFIEMSDDAQGATAVAAMNGSIHEGRELKVSEARPPVSSRAGGGRQDDMEE